MDPATIIGTASAILSFVQFTGKTISTVIEIRDNAGQATKSNQALDATLSEFNSRLARLKSQTPVMSTRSSGVPTAEEDAQASLLLSLSKCEDLGSKIQKLLNKIGIKKIDGIKSSAEKSRLQEPRHGTPEHGPSALPAKASLTQAFKATIKSLWLERDIKSLHEQWENCVKDFNVNFMRLDFQVRFQTLQKVADANSTTLTALQGDLQTLVRDCKDTNLKELGSFLDDYNRQNSKTAKEKRNCEYILNSLEFPGMDARRDQVHDAARNTFTWLLSSDQIPQYHDDLTISLRKWLATGNGTYHVTGKPGSGKSTCMKLIAESPESWEQLQEWASQEQKQLINASFFVWKAADANKLQSKVEGIMRTVLYQILAKAPGLISRVFPRYWHPERFHSNSNIMGANLQPRDIQEASERVFMSSDIVETYRIFLLIDGLDELDDDREAHFQVAKRVKGWCERNPDSVKACVSSREDSPFMNTFPSHQRLRLHLVTYDDIRELTEQRLMDHSHFASSYFTYEQRQVLIESIANQAEGVFLWVVLTIVELTHHLDAQQDFETLRRVVGHGNKNLDKFFKEVIARIPDTYREEARALFQIVQFTTRENSYYSQSLCLFHVYKAATHANGARRLTRPTHDVIKHEDAVEEVESFKLRIPTVTRGLLELREQLKWEEQEESEESTESREVTGLIEPTSALAGPHALCNLTFIHRSVFDFFEGNANALWNEDLADTDSDVLGLILDSSAEIADTLSWEQPQVRGYGVYDAVDHWRDIVFGLMNLLDESADEREVTDSDFASLKALDGALFRKQGVLPESVQLDSSQWSDVCLPHSVFNLASVFLTAFNSIPKHTCQGLSSD